ncbi:MAG: hypothetical protein GWO41_00845, partial [candidate division Zixibacteria bacterium]|nr:hypothetical protein [candidate division Zixibacteria bacterium]NIR63778.1 hypothetical protein [candidate division Zixibacteria bacterium]NIS45735.1 hypothetical protein [candidate division Zixibacteria bacterium]NIT51329.1 hypothetical protein [candidate division Zixibacteria bacterium]NIU13856.1 hypothetical protein [candidate division Zixibacteria bacterium]
MMGWTPPASEEQEEPECSDDDVARQCQNCISAVKCFFINESVDSPPFEQDCPDGIRFCKKKDRRVPAEWDGCEDGFEPVKVKSTQHNGYNPIYSCNNFGDNDGIQKNSENDQDQICADLAERNRELESELEQLRKELNASDSELEDKCVELDDIEADYASLKMALRGYCRLLINHQHKYLCRQ